MNVQIKKSKLQQVCNVIATAKWMDLIGVAIVIAVAVSAGYATETLGQVAKWAFSLGLAWVPFGLISIVK